MIGLYENETFYDTPFFRVLEDEFQKMNDGQKAAVTHNHGAALCIAGPGSGKTRVISLRAVRLLSENERYDKGVVLTLAFNKPAGVEMKERGEMYCRKIWPEKTETVLRKAKFVTIHAYCYELVRMYLSKANKKLPRVITEEESIDFIEKSYLSITEKRSISKDVLKRVKGFVLRESVKRNNADVNPSQQEILDKIGEDYRRYKKQYDLIDFQDMQEMAKLFLENDENFRNEIKSRYIYTQIDEAQDLSLEQLEIIKLISHDNVFFVADDDQSIYGFRGANPGILKTVESTFFDLKKYLLNINYRSNEEIVELSSDFIKENTDRFRKRINANRSKGGNIEIKTVFSVEGEARFVSDKILECVENNRSICILYRNNSSALINLANLFLTSLKRNEKEKLQLMPNVYGEGISLSEYSFVGSLLKEIRNIEDDPSRFFVPNVNKAISILEKNKLLDMIMLSGGLAGRRPFFIESVKRTLILLGKKCNSYDELGRVLSDFDKFKRRSKEKGNVSFSTVHSSKGLEFDDVIIVDCVKGEFPNGDVKKAEILREERRLMYVAMTRAKDNLYIISPLRCGKLYLERSLFVDELTR